MSDTKILRERLDMLAGMSPELQPGTYVFCTTPAASEAMVAAALALVREDDGVTLVLPEAQARAMGFPADLPMVQIVLRVFSALDVVGLTAAVASVLAAHGIACNVIAAFHHDHVFVPHAQGPQAMALLRDLQRQAAGG